MVRTTTRTVSKLLSVILNVHLQYGIKLTVIEYVMKFCFNTLECSPICIIAMYSYCNVSETVLEHQKFPYVRYADEQYIAVYTLLPQLYRSS